MAESRSLRANRNWVFDQELDEKEAESDGGDMFKDDKGSEHWVVIMLPEEIKKTQIIQIQGRLGFINASETVSGSKVKGTMKTETEKGIGVSFGFNVDKGDKLQVEKEDLWYKHTALIIKAFPNYDASKNYLNRIATDKLILRHLSEGNYRMFAITSSNLSTMKRMKNPEVYTDFFVKNYFDDAEKGAVLAGKRGAAAHIFTYEESEKHDFALMLPFREINTKRIAEALMSLEQAFRIEREDYDAEYELIVVKSVGTKEQAANYMNLVMKDKTIFDRLAGINYEAFIITQNNLKVLLDNHFAEEYVKFFNDNYLKTLDMSGGVEDGDFVYNKNLDHRFVLIYSNSVDPFKLKSVFEEFNFAGLQINNSRYNDQNDCMIVSGFTNKDEAMRYFNTVIKNRKLFKPLKNEDYRNFIITDGNLDILISKQLLEQYLLFFKKYYLNN